MKTKEILNFHGLLDQILFIFLIMPDHVNNVMPYTDAIVDIYR